MKKILFLVLSLFAASLSSCNNTSPKHKPYTVTFNGNGGTLISGDEVQTVKSSSEIVPPVYEKEEYKFDGWDKSITTIKTTTTVYALWLYNPSSDVSLEIDGFTKDGKELKNSVNNDMSSFVFGDNVHVNKYSSWKVYYDPGLVYEIESKTVSLNIGDNIVYMHVTAPSGNHEIYAITIYRKKMFNIIFDSDGGAPVNPISIQEGDVLESVPTSTKDGHTFKGWDYDFFNPILGNINTKAVWDVNSYDVNVINSDTSKGSVSGAGKFVYNSTTTITATPFSGYKFIGWYKDGKKVSDDSSYTITIPSYNSTYTANWSSLLEPTLTINDYNNEWGHTTGSGDYPYNQDVTVVAIPNTGCNFAGWYSNGTCLSTNLSYTFKMPADGLVISAIFNRDGQTFYFKKMTDNTLSIDYCIHTINNSQIPTYGIYQNSIYEITSIGEYAFANDQLVSITVPDSITFIDKSAFEGCSSLTSLTIPNNVTSIGEYAFKGCTSLASLTLPSLFDMRLSYYFNDYVPASLKSVTLTNCTSIGSNAFYYCYPLTSITIPNNVTSIGSGAFSYCSSLTDITIPNNVTSIGKAAFSDCSSLVSINIPVGVTVISDDIFSGCSSLANITIPNNTTSVGKAAFSGCSSLTNIVIPNGVTSIGEDAFSGCTSLESLTLPSLFDRCLSYYFDGTVPTSLKSVVLTNCSSICASAFEGCSSLTTIVIPDGVTSINGDTFSGCSSLTNITIPDGVTYIGSNAFSGCSSLTSINIPNGVTSIGEDAFSGCTSLESLTLPSLFDRRLSYYFDDNVPTSLKSVVLTNCSSICTSAFEGCSSLTSIILPNNVTAIGEDAFSGCSSLESLTLPSLFHEKLSYYFNGDIPVSLKNVTLTNCTYIIKSAFEDCSYLTSITLPNNVTSIGGSAFKNCSSLANINIPNGVSYVVESTFEGCSSLTQIAIPNSVTSIGYKAFYHCSLLNLLDLSKCDHVVTADTDFLVGTVPPEIRVKSSLVDAYKSAPNWVYYGQYIVGV